MEGHAHFHKLLKDFRSQIVALGAFWIFIGAVAIAAGVMARFMTTDSNHDAAANLLLTILGVAGSIWVVLGVCVCLKQIWALYVALVLSYLSLLSSLFRLQFCAIVLLGVVVFQAHRVLRWSKELRGAGIPLTTRPEHLQIPTTI